MTAEKPLNHGSPATKWALFVRGWRPACGWMIALLLARALVVPVVQLILRQPVEPIDWTALSALSAVLFVSRTYERSQGIA